jgi:hypothetical protein
METFDALCKYFPFLMVLTIIIVYSGKVTF